MIHHQAILRTLIIFNLHHRVAQEALWLRCVRSICCGALQHQKKTVEVYIACYIYTYRYLVKQPLTYLYIFVIYFSVKEKSLS
jgi:hypothetical protein